MRVTLALLCVLSAGCQEILGLDSSTPPAGSELDLGDCDPVAQSGCNSGEKCAFLQELSGFGDFACTNDDGNGAEGQSCDPDQAVDNCEAGLHCVRGTCLEICDSTISCSRGDCRPLLEKAAVGVDFSVCSQQCSPFAQDCDDLACYLVPLEQTLCLAGGAIPVLDNCNDETDCEPGSGCHRTPFGDRLCLTYCDLPNCTDGNGEPNTCGCSSCGDNDVCVEVDDPQFKGQGHGVCLNAEEVGCFCSAPGGDAFCGKQKG